MKIAPKTHRRLTASLLGGLALLSLAGCGDSTAGTGTTGGSTTPSSSNPNTPPAPPAAPAAVTTTDSKVVATKASAVKDASQPYQLSLQAGWNTFSMPFSTLDTFTVDQPSSILSCFAYNASTGSYVAQTFTQTALAATNPFQGYWLFCSGPVQVTLNGELSTQNPLQTNLALGWNLVGTPVSNDASVSAFQFNSESLAGCSFRGSLQSSLSGRPGRPGGVRQ